MKKFTSPAFPTYLADNVAHGMSIRDFFAAAAMPLAYQYWMQDYYHPKNTDLIKNREKENPDRNPLDCDMKEVIALCAYDMADAMMIARKE